MPLSLFWLLAQVPPAPEPKVLTSTDPAYRVEIPVGYKPVELHNLKPFWARSFPGFPETLELRLLPYVGPFQEGMRAPYGFLRDPELPPETKEAPFEPVWRHLPLYGAEHRWYTTEGEQLALSAALPLLPRGLILRLQGPLKRERDLRADFDRILLSVRGATEWTTAESKADRRKARSSVLAGALSAGLYFALWAGVFRRSFRMAHWPRTLWLTLTAFCFLYPAILGVDVWGMAPATVLLLMAVRRIKLGIETG